MSVEKAVAVAKLVSELGRVSGRKRLQKIVHLLSAKKYPEFQYRFILHFFGPFSRELAADLDFLVDAKLITEKPPTQEEGGAYSYTVPDGKVRNEVDEFYKDFRGDSSDWADWVKPLNKEKTPFLEALSTVVLLANRRTKASSLQAEFETTKPHLKARFQAAHERALELDLLST